jgi:hypothetical protein
MSCCDAARGRRVRAKASQIAFAVFAHLRTYARLVERLERANDKRDAYLEPALSILLVRLMRQEQLDELLKAPT